MTRPLIEFHLDGKSGLPPYQQLVRQVRHALRLGLLRQGDQLRTLTDATFAAHGPLRQDLQRWLAKAHRAGLDDESIEALFMTTFRTAAHEDVA